MPLQWKKMKSQRLSQLVNDHLHKSQKRRDGSSLVVETGFPTSLVDLFIKNRKNLKKTSHKKRQNPPITSLSDVNDPLIAGSTPSLLSIPSPHSPVISPLITVSSSRSPSVSPSSLPLPSESMNGSLAVGPSDGSDERNRSADTGIHLHTILLMVFKVFLVVVLALGTRRLTVGITISAFLLLLLEFVSNHARAVVKPETEGVSESTILRYLRLLRLREVKLYENNENNDEVSTSKLDQDNLVKPGCSLKYYGSTCQDHEIQVVESNRYFVNHTVDVSKEGVTIEKEEASTCEEVAGSKRRSRKAKIKSKMTKFIPKKLRCSRKEPDSKRGVVEIVKGYDNSISRREGENESDNASDLSSVSSRRYKELDNTNSAFVRVSDVSEEIVTKRVEGLNWKYLVHCVIILAGLICSRTFAVLLTLSWFLLLKLGGKLPKGT